MSLCGVCMSVSVLVLVLSVASPAAQMKTCRSAMLWLYEHNIALSRRCEPAPLQSLMSFWLIDNGHTHDLTRFPPRVHAGAHPRVGICG